MAVHYQRYTLSGLGSREDGSGEICLGLAGLMFKYVIMFKSWFGRRFWLLKSYTRLILVVWSEVDGRILTSTRLRCEAV